MSENTEASEQIIAIQEQKRNKPKFPRHNHPKWDVFWISMTILIIGLQIIFLFTTTIPLEDYLPIAQFAIIGLIVSFIISSKTVTDGYSIPKQAICYMGSLKGRSSGKSNAIALTFFVIFGILYGVLNFTLMHFYWTYYPENPILTNARRTLLLSTLVIIMMAITPIDINEKKHFYWAFPVFVITEVASGFSIAYFIIEKIDFPLLYIIVVIEFVLAAGYIWGFLSHYRYAPVFQKTCIMFTGIAFYLYLHYLVGI